MSSPQKRQRTETQFQQLSAFTTVVADTGEVEAIKKYEPLDATTNPSLIYKAALLPAYADIVNESITYAKANAQGFENQLDLAMDKLAVAFGTEITKIVPGYVSTEVDARLSFNTQATIDKAHRLIDLYREAGVDKSRILVKIAATYEGIRAAEVLEAEGITCNLTLLFSLVQAAACAEARCTLISPFVGRIMDWHKAKTGNTYVGAEDPGVQSVSTIYGYYKKFGYNTIVMGASFRNKGEILNLAGCDKLTISPNLLAELQASSEPVERVLDPSSANSLYPGDRIPVDEQNFRWSLNEDAMATEKLSEGIRNFAADIVKLEAIIGAKLRE